MSAADTGTTALRLALSNPVLRINRWKCRRRFLGRHEIFVRRATCSSRTTSISAAISDWTRSVRCPSVQITAVVSAPLETPRCAWTSCHYSRKGPFWAMCGAFRAVRIAALGNGQRMKQSSKSARLGSARAAPAVASGSFRRDTHEPFLWHRNPRCRITWSPPSTCAAAKSCSTRSCTAPTWSSGSGFGTHLHSVLWWKCVA